MGKVNIAEHGLRAVYRYVGYTGIARNSDRVSADYFLVISGNDVCTRKGLFREG